MFLSCTIRFSDAQRARLIMSTFERYLTIWVACASLLALHLATLFPAYFTSLGLPKSPRSIYRSRS